MKKDEILSQLAREVLNNDSFRTSFSYLEKYVHMGEIKKFQELIEKKFKASCEEIWTDSSDLIQEAEKAIQQMEMEQENFNCSVEGAKVREEKTKQFMEEANLRGILQNIEREIMLRKNERDSNNSIQKGEEKIQQMERAQENFNRIVEGSQGVTKKISDNSQTKLFQENKKNGLFKIFQRNKEEGNNHRNLDREILGLQEELVQRRKDVTLQIAYTEKNIREIERAAQKAYPQLGQLLQTKQAADKAVEKVKGSLRVKLKERLTLVTNKKLQELTAPDTENLPPYFCAWGITEVFDSNYVIVTTHGKKLTRLLEEMIGGSIGISGPRGAGKSTLMRSFCGTDSRGSLKGRSVFSIMLSAPVKYETRDFVLHIFSSVCNLVLANLHQKINNSGELGKTEADFKEDRKPEEIKSSLVPNLRKNVKQLFGQRILSTFKLLGPSLIMLSFLLAYTSTFRLPQYEKGVAETAVLNSSQPKTSPQNTKVKSLYFQNKILLDIFLLKYFMALGITPSSLLMWGTILSILGLSSSHLKIKMPKHSTNQNILNLEANNDLHESASPKLLLEARLLEEAETNLKNIHFQQSYTSGWAGSIKLPILLETSTNQATTLSKMQMTFPEIIHNYKKFVGDFLNITESVVYIGIDELDKLESDKVQIFLNDIKALFGIENCFYLISVSEDAMSSFERRGIPFRDVFDSTFDTIIYVDYLTIEEARNLIDQRVIGLPQSMFYFIYCFSSGLARDLIRSCRSLLENIDLSNTNSFQEISASNLYTQAISRDIAAKLRSIYIEAKKVTVEFSARDFLKATRQIEQIVKDGLSSKALLEVCKTLQNNDTIVADPSKKEDSNIASLENLKIELITYLYYMATLFEIFVEKSCSSILNGSNESISYLSNLTKARQFFTVNPAFACLLISDFRETQQLESILKSGNN
jgi:hypothetical protein